MDEPKSYFCPIRRDICVSDCRFYVVHRDTCVFRELTMTCYEALNYLMHVLSIEYSDRQLSAEERKTSHPFKRLR